MKQDRLQEKKVHRKLMQLLAKHVKTDKDYKDCGDIAGLPKIISR